jgi:hypothetical protein
MATLAVASGVLAVAGPAGTDAANGVTCGAAVTSSVVLEHDLLCTGDGLYVDNDNGEDVVIDLNGHTISGSGAGTGLVIGSSSSSRFLAVVRNGVIDRFGVGVDATSGANVDLRSLRLRNHADTAVRFFDTVAVLDTVMVMRSGNGVTAGESFLTMVNSVITRNGGAGLSADFGAMAVETSTISHNGGGGIIAFNNGVTLAESTVFGNTGPGVQTSDSGTIIDTAIIARNTGPGIELCPVAGQSYSSVVANSWIGRNLVGFRYAPGCEEITDNALRLENNGFVENEGPGAFVEVRRSQQSVIARNRSMSNGIGPGVVTDASGAPVTDGIRVSLLDGPAAAAFELYSNRAFTNAGHGIFAPGVFDGGRNKAGDNGGPAQCVGVTCT